MKKLLYLITMFLNVSGVLFCVSMCFTLKTIFLQYLPLVLLSIAIFTFSFGLTFWDFSNRITRPKAKYQLKPQITDYREYFSQRRNEFLI